MAHKHLSDDVTPCKGGNTARYRNGPPDKEEEGENKMRNNSWISPETAKNAKIIFAKS